MALSNSETSQRRLMIRSFGLTMLMLAGVGAILAVAGFLEIGLGVLAVGALAALGVLGYEIVQHMTGLTGQRGSAGIQVLVQVVLAAGLFLGVNVLAFMHYYRFDCTRDRIFTLSPDLQEKFRQLRGETIIVVDQRHSTFGRLRSADRSADTDRYEKAAGRKVAEKVNDLVDQLREFGPQFRVVELDSDDENIDKKLDNLTNPTDGSPAREDLRKAIDTAPENSIFFYSREPGETNGKVQRLAFNAFYLLDKTASKSDNDRRGNLVLRHQGRGVEAFARRVLNIDTRRPRVGLLVADDFLGTHGHEIAGLKGFGQSLQNNGFDVREIILKKNFQEPVVYTYEESRFDDLEEQVEYYKKRADTSDEALKSYESHLKKIREGDEKQLARILAEVTVNEAIQTGEIADEDEAKKEFARLADKIAKDLKGVPEARRKAVEKYAAEYLTQRTKKFQEERDVARKAQDKAATERATLNLESAKELRRRTDLYEKLKTLLADCDLVILPRFTVYTVKPPQLLPINVHSLDEAQIRALKGYLASGKPMLACFGPNTLPPQMMQQMMMQGMRPQPSDGVDTLLNDLNIKLGRQMVLYHAEMKDLASTRQELGVGHTGENLPSVQFDWKTRTAPSLADLKEDVEGAPRKNSTPNQVRESLRLAASSIGSDLDLKIPYARPVYYTGKDRDKLAFDPEFMRSDERSWNEDRPFPMGKSYRPEPPQESDPTGTLEKKGNGPFPLGVAVEADVPAAWGPSEGEKADKVRVAVIGHGGLFAGNELKPAKEKLLLDTCNWLVGREDLLAAEGGIWKYPRLHDFSDRKKALWTLGARWILPGFFIYLGLVVLMVRQIR